jgi:2-polyprenyl-6-methoxyphenol hydroxylase-like FAD-dependent oxidoreductase
VTAVKKVAIAGGGVAGLASAIQLAKVGVEVDVFELKPELGVLGSGITIQGNALRVFGALGAWEEIRDKGYAFEGLTIRAPGPGAPAVAELPDIKTGGPDYPAAMGMYRPDLTAILLKHAEAAGANVRFGAAVTDLVSSADSVAVEVNRKPLGTYDLLIGADGLNSTVRRMLGIETVPKPTGMGIWRASVSRPAEVVHSELYYGGPVYIAGYTPTGEDSMYAYIVEGAQERTGITDVEASRIMIEQSQGYFGPWDSIRADLQNGSRVNYTWFTSHIVDAPWNRGRSVIIGDAAHSCPPTIAQGAAQGLEDALVLTELLTSRDKVDRSLWDEFHERRLPRARRVVEASVQLGQWQLDGDHDADAGGLIFGVAHEMAQPV